MSRKFYIFIIAAICFILIGWGEYIIPNRLEISDVQIVQVVGFDEDDDKKVSMSLLFEPHSNSANSKESESKKMSEKYLTVTADTFAENEQGIQYYEDKIFIGSHVKDIIIGENLAKNDLVEAMDFIGKNDEFRLDSKMYIAREMPASEVFDRGINNNYKLVNRIDNLSLTKKGYRDTRTVEIIDIIQMLLEEGKAGVIPCIQIVKNGDSQLDDYMINTSPDEGYRVELFGYGVIYDGKLVGYLDKEESNGYDYIKNLVTEDAVSLKNGNNKIGLTLKSSNAKMSFQFNGEELKKVVIDIKTNNSILETTRGDNIFDTDLSRVEELENEYIKTLVMSTIKYAQNSGVDFIGVKEKLKLYHPYKWRNIENNWKEIFKNVKFEVNVDSKIDEEYGILRMRGNNER